MNRYVIILWLLIVYQTGVNAQAVNETNGTWKNITAWEGTFVHHIVRINKTDGTPGLRLYYQPLKCNKYNGSSNGRRTATNANNPGGDIYFEQGAIALKNTDPGIVIYDVSVGIDGITCDGTSTTVKVGTNSLSPYEIKQVENSSIFKEINRVSSVSFGWTVRKNDREYHYSAIYDARTSVSKILIDGIDQDEWSNQQQQALQQSKKQLEDERKRFDDEVASYKKLLNTIQDPQLKNKYTTVIDGAQAQFNSTYQTALNTQDIEKLQQQSDGLSKIEENLSTNINGLNKAVEKQATASVQQHSIAGKPSQVNQPLTFNRVNTTGTNTNVQNSINYINTAQAAPDGITQANDLNQADLILLYEQTHGNNSQQVRELRAQIAQLKKQYADQNNAALQQSLSNLSGTGNDNVDMSKALNDLMDKNTQAEREKENNKTELKNSMSGFFNSFSLKKTLPDTSKAKADTIKARIHR